MIRNDLDIGKGQSHEFAKLSNGRGDAVSTVIRPTDYTAGIPLRRKLYTENRKFLIRDLQTLDPHGGNVIGCRQHFTNIYAEMRTCFSRFVNQKSFVTGEDLTSANRLLFKLSMRN